jgi:GNAT superfamily N-acetyltransferase
MHRRPTGWSRHDGAYRMGAEPRGDGGRLHAAGRRLERAGTPATELDRAQLRELHFRVSDESIYRRFFSANRKAAQAFVDVICGPGPGAWALVAVHSGRIVGVASAIETGEGTAEIALLVDESLHGVGIGTALLEKLAAEGRRRGLSGFVADVLTENLPMLRVIHDAGFSLDEHREYGVVSLTLDLTLSPEGVAAAGRRERQAQRRSLTPLFEPQSVAVVGVSRRRGRIGREVLENIKAGGFDGPWRQPRARRKGSVALTDA